MIEVDSLVLVVVEADRGLHCEDHKLLEIHCLVGSLCAEDLHVSLFDFEAIDRLLGFICVFDGPG